MSHGTPRHRDVIVKPVVCLVGYALAVTPAIEIPKHFTVWAASDVHGQLGAFDRLLAAAGLTDAELRWAAPPATALVITGDLVDRGPDSIGLVRRVAALREQAPGAGGMVAILEGNHEMQVLGGLDGQPDLFTALLTFGGGGTFLNAGMAPGEWAGMAPAEIADRVDQAAPEFRATLATFAPYARWGDTLLVHGGPVPHQDLDSFERSADRLWIRSDFFDSQDLFPDADAWTAYRDAGIRRVVFGHTPVDRPTLCHEGRALNIDTWRGGQVTLARLDPGRDLASAVFLAEPAEPRAIADAPVSREDILRFDRELPAIVDAWRSPARS